MRPLLRIAPAPFRGYWTGATRSTPALIGFLPPGIVLIAFDDQGRVQGVESRAFGFDVLSEWQLPPVDPADGKVLRPKSFAELRRWQGEVEFIEHPIAVAPFDLRSKYGVALDYAPDHMKEILSHPDDYDAEEVEEARDYVEEWQDWYMHSFTWEVEYLLDSDGIVTST